MTRLSAEEIVYNVTCKHKQLENIKEKLKYIQNNIKFLIHMSLEYYIKKKKNQKKMRKGQYERWYLRSVFPEADPEARIHGQVIQKRNTPCRDQQGSMESRRGKRRKSCQGAVSDKVRQIQLWPDLAGECWSKLTSELPKAKKVTCCTPTSVGHWSRAVWKE